LAVVTMFEDGDITCDGIGNPVFTDNDNKKFFASYVSANLSVNVGDCARLQTESADDENQEFNYAQVLAIYEDANEEMFVEVRWFLDEYSLPDKKKELMKLQPNELVESDQLDDVSAGAVCEIVRLTDTKKRKKGMRHL
jgi:hypothetical protein